MIDADYGLQIFLRAVVFRENRRCTACYRMRLEQTARLAKKNGHEGFSTTLLYSTYQNHELIKTQAHAASMDQQLPFVYHDFRTGWQQGVDEAKRCGLYRQSYCGCIYSEQERYDNRLKKKMKRETISDVQPSRSGHHQP